MFIVLPRQLAGTTCFYFNGEHDILRITYYTSVNKGIFLSNHQKNISPKTAEYEDASFYRTDVRADFHCDFNAILIEINVLFFHAICEIKLHCVRVAIHSRQTYDVACIQCCVLMRIHTFSRVAGWLTFVTLIDCMVLVLFRVTPMGIRFLAITTSEHMRGHR